MKIKHSIFSLMSVGICACMLSACVTAERKEAKLEAQAKVTRTDAEKIALAKVPDGTIKEGEIEKENGKLIWSFDIATPGSKDITEVQVDAVSGTIVAIEKESPSEQAKEKKK